MAILGELSGAIKQRRSELGLSQGRLGEIAGLSRATINELETGKISNLSLSRAERLANALGLSLGVTGTRQSSTAGAALNTASRTASVSYRTMLPPQILSEALGSGSVPATFAPHLRVLLDEAPLALLANVAGEMEARNGTRRHVTWQTMRTLAEKLGCTRDIWH